MRTLSCCEAIGRIDCLTFATLNCSELSFCIMEGYSPYLPSGLFHLLVVV